MKCASTSGCCEPARETSGGLATVLHALPVLCDTGSVPPDTASTMSSTVAHCGSTARSYVTMSRACVVSRRRCVVVPPSRTTLSARTTKAPPVSFVTPTPVPAAAISACMRVGENRNSSPVVASTKA
jgi:hypothetical protein